MFYWDQPVDQQVDWVTRVVHCSIGKKMLSVGLVAQLFQPASNWVEMIETALVVTAGVFTGTNSCFLCD